MINLQDDEYPDFEPLECEMEDCDEDAEDEFKNHWYCNSCLDKLLVNGTQAFKLSAKLKERE